MPDNDKPGKAPPEPAPDEHMTLEELKALVEKTVSSSSISTAMEKALEPLTKAQGDYFKGMIDAREKAETDKPLNLGKYPIGRKTRALAMGGNDPEKAAFEIKRAVGWPLSVAEDTLKWLEHVKTTLTAGTAATMGDMIMPQFDPEWIDLLRVNAVVRGMARTIPMPRGATSRRKQTGAGTAYYQGEVTTATQSNQTVGRANLSNKKLVALTVVSNDIIRFSGGEADRFVQEDLLNVSALREDRAFLFGNPPTDAGSPQGIRYQTKAAQIQASSGVTLANLQADLTESASQVESANVIGGTEDFCWIMSPALFWKIYSLATTAGDWVFAQGLSLNPPRLLGFEVVKARYMKEATLAADGYGTAGSAGYLLFVHKPSLEIHDSLQRSVTTWPGGAYHDTAAGVVASGISNDETVITCITEHDFLMVYDEACSIQTGYAY